MTACDDESLTGTARYNLRQQPEKRISILDLKNKELLFLNSAMTEQNPFNSTADILSWLRERNNEVQVTIRKIRFSELKQWHFAPDTGNLVHDSGKFFSIEGIHVKTNWGAVNEWTQPIINQPEIGYLGIITKIFDGVLYFLMQAKVEPGNINNVQISPTLQATKSNYTQVHKGGKSLYLEYFINQSEHTVLLDQLQSEQGARFLKKRNRNIILHVEDEIPVHDDFCWMTLGQIKKLIHTDNTVNMDTRTVISGISYGNFQSDVADFYNSVSPDTGKENTFSKGLLKSLIDCENSLYSFDDILSWLTQLKCEYELVTDHVPLKYVTGWSRNDYEIYDEVQKYFKVIAVDVGISSREVQQWTQPLIEPAQEGICAFIVKEINGIYHFLIQAKVECGNMDILEIAPTVQCMTGNYKNTSKGNLPFLEYVLTCSPDQVCYSCYQSEEGGRFYQEQNKNVVIEAGNSFPVDIPNNYNWLTLNQLLAFLKFNNFLNIQARSLVSSLIFCTHEPG